MGGDGNTGPDTSGQSSGTGGTASGSCPSVEPALGASCAPDAQSCLFINCVAPDYRDDHELTCVNGAWALTREAVCDEVAVACPPSTPVRGQACNAAETPGPCTTFDACGSVQLAYCTMGAWQYQTDDGADRIAPASGVGGSGTTGAMPDPIPAECPLAAPTLGTPCCPSNHPPVCDYGSGGSSGDSEFGAPVPAAGGASSGDAGTVQSVALATTVGMGGTSTSGAGGSGMAGSPSVAECVTCGAEMVWEASDECP